MFIPCESNVTFKKKKLYVFHSMSADGSCSIKWKWKDINARASVTRSWRWLPLVTWLLCRACGWLGGPSGCAAPVFELNDELCPGTLDTAAQLTPAHRGKKQCFTKIWWLTTGSFFSLYTYRYIHNQAGQKTDYLTLMSDAFIEQKQDNGQRRMVEHVTAHLNIFSHFVFVLLLLMLAA